MKKKYIFLFLALLLPILVFLFLKFFGRNEFDIPIQFVNGVPDSLQCEALHSKGQYILPDSIFKVNTLMGANLIVGGDESFVSRLKEDFTGKDWQIIFTKDMTDSLKIKNCILFLKKPWTAVLVDNQKRIRGYYALHHRDDMDRLIVDMAILTKKY